METPKYKTIISVLNASSEGFEEYLKMILQEEPAYRKLDFKIEYLEHKFCPMAGCEIKNFRIVKGEQTWH